MYAVGTNRICCNLSLCVGGDCYAWIVSSCAEDTSPAQPRVSARARETETRQLINLARGECGEVARVAWWAWQVTVTVHCHCSLLTLLTRGRGGPPPVPVACPECPAHPVIQSREVALHLKWRIISAVFCSARLG